ncbi:MAG: antibiotic biosynthesis monooxygenase, partial [Microbacterium sp.]
MAIVLSATWIAKPGEEETVRSALEKLSPASREEPGNLYYQAYQTPEEPNVFSTCPVYGLVVAIAIESLSSRGSGRTRGDA